jgi:nucleoside-diphosphate-sugar epimerase
MANILIIGGTGFLSGTTARQALAAGHNVWSISRGQRPVPDGVRALTADRHDQAAFEAAITGADVHWDLAVDCIAFTPEDIQQDVTVLAPLVKHLIFVSTDFVYDPQHRKFPQDEESDWYLKGAYGGLKRQAELTLIAADSGSMHWTIVRPGHIYGPGSQLGCLPAHSRDANLIAKLRSGEALQLVGGGHFLQQPILARDLADCMLSMQDNTATYGQIFCVAGPDTVEARDYYRIIAEALGVELKISEIAVDAYLREHPEAAYFLCHRMYDLTKLRESGAKVPGTSLADGLREHIQSLL